MRTRALMLTCWLTSGIFYMPSLHAADFKLVGREKQISLFERWIPSGGGETVRELKATFVVYSDIPPVVRILKDERKNAEWNVNAEDLKILKTRDISRWIAYIKYDIPWPLNDQDCCLEYRCTGDTNRMVITFESTLNLRFPITSGIDRITGVKGKWILQKADQNSIKVIYLITTDRSNKVPRWISDKIIHSNLYDTMSAFRDVAEDKV